MAAENQQKNSIHMVMRISKRGGGEVSPTHVAVIAKGAAMMLARLEHNDDAGEHDNRWAQQGRTLISASHVVAARPMQPRSVAWSKAAQRSTAERRSR